MDKKATNVVILIHFLRVVLGQGKLGHLAEHSNLRADKSDISIPVTCGMFCHADCCSSVEVSQGKNANPAAKNAQPAIFTTYHIERSLLTAGNSFESIHYTSKDGTKAITYGNGKWRIQSANLRYMIIVE